MGRTVLYKNACQAFINPWTPANRIHRYARRKKRVFKRAEASCASTSQTEFDPENSYVRPVVSPRTRTGAFSRYEMATNDATNDPAGAVAERGICAGAEALTNGEKALGAVAARPDSIPRKGSIRR